MLGDMSKVGNAAIDAKPLLCAYDRIELFLWFYIPSVVPRQLIANRPKRRQISQNARLSFNTARELAFRGSLVEWERLMGAVARR